MARVQRAVALVVTFVLVACGGGSDRSTGDDPVGGAGGDALRIAVGEDIWPLTGQGPSSKHFAAGELSVGVYEPLLRLGTDFTVQPGLAERWELVEPQRWRFHLRQQVRFHDGRSFGADDVVWSWTGRQFLPGAVEGVLDSVVKVDDHTVDFVLRTIDNRLPEKLVHPEGPIVPRRGHNDDSPPAGTGPYKVVDYRPRQRVVVERYDEYWGDKPTVRRLTFLFTPDPAERVELLLAGDVDLATSLPAASVAQVEAKADFRVARAPVGATQTLSFNTSGVPPAREVRQAVSLAIDRGAYVNEVLKGNGEAGRWMSPGPVLGTAGSVVVAVPADPVEARRVLDAAGWRAGNDGVRVKEGQRLTLTLVGGPSVPEPGLRFVRDRLRDVGIEVAMKYGQDIATYQDFRQKGFDLDLTQPNQNNADPSFLIAGRASGAQTAAAQTATSREAVQQVAADAMRGFINQEYVVVPLAHVSRLYGLRPGVDLANLHPSAISQSWVGLSAA